MGRTNPSLGLRVLMAALAGLEAGVLGGAAALAMLVLTSFWRREPWWYIPNLFASMFYGAGAARAGFGMVTVSGLALHVTTSGLVGLLFGIAFGGVRSPLRLFFLGIAVGLTGSYLIPMLLPIQAGSHLVRYGYRSVIWACVAFGVCLSQTGRYLRSIETVRVR